MFAFMFRQRPVFPGLRDTFPMLSAIRFANLSAIPFAAELFGKFSQVEQLLFVAIHPGLLASHENDRRIKASFNGLKSECFLSVFVPSVLDVWRTMSVVPEFAPMVPKATTKISGTSNVSSPRCDMSDRVNTRAAWKSIARVVVWHGSIVPELGYE